MFYLRLRINQSIHYLQLHLYLYTNAVGRRIRLRGEVEGQEYLGNHLTGKLVTSSGQTRGTADLRPSAKK